MVSEARDFTPLYQEMSSNLYEGEKISARIEQRVASGKLRDTDIFVFTENLVFESVFYKGTSKNLLLFEIVIRLHQVEYCYPLMILNQRN